MYAPRGKAMWGHSRKMAIYEPNLEVLASRTVRKWMYFLGPLSLWHFFIISKKPNTARDHFSVHCSLIPLSRYHESLAKGSLLNSLERSLSPSLTTMTRSPRGQQSLRNEARFLVLYFRYGQGATLFSLAYFVPFLRPKKWSKTG